MHRNNATADGSPSEITTDNENKHNSSEEAWTDVNLNEEGDAVTNLRDDPRNIHNIVHTEGMRYTYDNIFKCLTSCGYIYIYIYIWK
jgi:hypothetical protein